ncbi:DUF4214 domain-containing protein [Duganella sp. BuS-21]|uniref:DUF4214 domain-containing protein n=1 Tax=Duganella sp. BuS-21 TaxID=2943848 RepID=UPI0035A6F67F
MNDLTAPTLLKLNLPTTIDLSARPQRVSFSAEAEDNLGGSGVRGLIINFDRDLSTSTGPTTFVSIGSLYNFDDSFLDDTPTTASRSYTITTATAPGVYNVNSVWVTDLAGNSIMYHRDQLTDLGIPTSMTVTGSVADTVAPTLVRLNLPTTVDLATGPQDLSIFAEARDNTGGSGVFEITIYFDNDLIFDYGASGYFWIGGSVSYVRDSFNDDTPTTASNTATLTAPTAPRVYTITKVSVQDVTGNTAIYTTEQLQALGINTTMTVRDKTSVPATASLTPTVSEQGVTLSLDSLDWSPSGSNTVALTLNYDANAAHYNGLSVTNSATSFLSSNVSETGGVATLTIYGAFTTAAEAKSALNLLLTPTSATGTVSYFLDSFAVNGKEQAMGTSASGKLYHGAAGADLIASADGLSHVDGGSGIDTAVFSSTTDSYKISKTAGGYTVDNNNDHLTALTHVERLRFTDYSLSIDGDGADGQIYRLYQAAFDREPDRAGIGYWMAQMDHGASLIQIANAFATGKEFSDLYGANTDSKAFLTALYQNVLHRAPDAAGYDYWLDVLEHAYRADVLVAFSESSENVAQVVGAIESGFIYTPWV